MNLQCSTIILIGFLAGGAVSGDESVSTPTQFDIPADTDTPGAPDFQLKGVLISKSSRVALVNDKAIRAGDVHVDGIAARASRDVTAGEVLTIVTGLNRLEVEILEVPVLQVSRKDAPGFYRVVSRSPETPS